MNAFYVLCAEQKRLFLVFAWWVACLSLASATLICPANLTITAPPQSCEATLDFNSLAWSSTVTLVDTIFNPGPGHVFPIGLTPVSLTGVEVGGGIVTCAFTVTVQGNNNPQMACEDAVPVFLDDDCTKTISLDMMLVGIYGCPSNYSIARITPMGGIVSPAIMDEGDVGETVTIRVTNLVIGQTCWGSVEVVPYSLPLSIACPPDAIIQCNQEPLPALSGEADYFSCLPTDEITLTYLDSYTDLNCGDDFVSEIDRFWKVTDRYFNERICTQTIQVRRNTLSQIISPIDTLFSCNDFDSNPMLTEPANAGEPTIGGLPIPASCDMTIDYEDLILTICEASYKILRTWTMVDWCNTQVVQHQQIIRVLDTQGPSILMADTVFISTDTACGLDANLPEAAISDDCSGFIVQVVTPWDTIEGNGGFTVIAVPTGSYPGKYIATDACGNIAEHPIVIQVQDGTLVSCPPNMAVDCEFFIETLETALNAQDYSVLEQFGEMQFYANCLVTPTQTVALDINDCKAGTITRTLGAEELADQCVQTITVEAISDFIVEFPANLTINCGESPFHLGEPVLFGVSCENIETSFTDEIFNIVPDACYKIVRTWVVQNTCVSTGNDTALDIVETQLNFPDCDLNGDGACSSRTFKAGIDGYITYQQVIKVQDSVAPVFLNGCSIPAVIIVGGACHTNLELPIPAVAECTDDWVMSTQILINNGWQTVTGPFPNVPTGTYQVSYTAVDKCYNQHTCWTNVQVKENTPPVVNCLQDLQIIYMPHSGIVDVHAYEFVVDVQDNCGGNVSLSFSTSPGDNTKSLTCNDVELDLLDIYAIDKNGNHSVCQVPILIISEADCSVSVAGTIKTETGVGVSNVIIESNFGTTITDSLGRFYAGETYNEASVTLTPSKNLNHTNGVTTFDIVLIRKHILDIERLDSPYKIIAADVNRSNAVSTFDLVLLTKLIIHVVDELPNNTSWRFVPKYWFFPNPNNPFEPPFPEGLNPNYPGFSEAFDFIAIKVGDVNGSADPKYFSLIPADRITSPQTVEDD
ncbi:MAG: hypothetical protein IPN76_24190 [Saprospiraceae bacterium]|nr:hypothetical protein [Saprospiraceae bacterium]